jgi:hypothetical protein
MIPRQSPGVRRGKTGDASTSGKHVMTRTGETIGLVFGAGLPFVAGKSSRRSWPSTVLPHPSNGKVVSRRRHLLDSRVE